MTSSAYNLERVMQTLIDEFSGRPWWRGVAAGDDGGKECVVLLLGEVSERNLSLIKLAVGYHIRKGGFDTPLRFEVVGDIRAL